MRITNQLLFSNFRNNYARSSSELNKMTSQISSGHKITNSYDDANVFMDTQRLEYEKTTLSQVKDSSKSAQEFANNSDTIMNEFNDGLTRFKTKLIEAANGSQNETSLNSIANDLESIKTNLKDLANSSINGKFLFSGTAFSTKPIDSDGNYNGNGKNVKATTGADSSLAYNIDGKSLFLGSDSDYKKMLSTNVKMYSDDNKTILKDSDTIKSLVENNGDNIGNINNQTKAYFYLQGKNSDGTSFKNKIEISTDSKINDLLDMIKNSFTPKNSVDVSLNDYGQIEVTDKNKGQKSLKFNMIGAVDKDGGNDADVTDVDSLTTGTNVNIISFVKSGYTNTSDAANEEVSFDRNYFSKNGDTLTSNVSQIDKTTNDFATAKTLLVNTSGKSSINNNELTIKYTDKDNNTNSAKIDFKSNGSTFTVNGNTYNIYNASGNATDGNKMTYQQLNDVVSMLVSNNLPATNSKNDYDSAVENAKKDVNVSLDYRGKLDIKDLHNSDSNIKFSMYDSKNDDFSSTDGNTLSFMSNDAITADEPSVDIFKDLENMIQSVRDGKVSMDSSGDNKREYGIENSIRRVEHIRDHVDKMHTKIGSLSNALNEAYQRSDMLSLQVTTLQSQISDVDIGAVLAKYDQVSVGFQAMLSTIAKVNKISLLNYM